VADLIEIESGSPTPPHDPTDLGKVERLAADMAARGWQGPPVVVDGDWALTGSHRIAAHMLLWDRDGIDVRIPRVQIGDLVTAAGWDWQADVADWDMAIRELSLGLPADLVDYLGLDQ